MHLTRTLLSALMTLWILTSSAQDNPLSPWPPQYEKTGNTHPTFLLYRDFMSKKTLSIPLNNDLPVLAELYFIDHHKAGSSCWVGKIKGQQWGYLILAETSGTIYGKAEMDNGDLFILTAKNSGDPVLIVQLEGAQEKANCTEEISYDEPDSDDDPGSNEDRNVLTLCDPPACNSVGVDLLIFYTEKAKQHLGGTHEMAQSAIAMAVSEMNMINLNSQVHHTYSLIHSELVNYDEIGEYDIDLAALRDPDDGIADEIHDVRDKYYADLTSFIVGLDGCGYGYVNSDSIRFDAQTSFNIVRDNCMVSKKTLAHEFGHNLGFRHDRYAYTVDGGDLPRAVCGIGYGWTNPAGQSGDPERAWHTIMAYDNQCDDWGIACQRIPYWSNPDITYNGDPIGSAIGNADQASNAYLLERSACQVTRFRVPPDCDSTCLLFQQCENYNLETDLGPGHFTYFVMEGDFPALDPEKDIIQICIYYFGDNSHYDELWNLFDEENHFLGQTVPAYDCDFPTRICIDLIPEWYNAWIEDQVIELFLDPYNTSINPEYCKLNRACIELLIYTESGTSAIHEETAGLNNIELVPNPADQSAILSFDATIFSEISIDLHDVHGRPIRNITRGHEGPGKKEYPIEVSDLSSGIYLCQIRTNQYLTTNKLVVAR